MRKFLPYIIILFVLVGLFGSAEKAWAVPCTGTDSASGLPTPAGCTTDDYGSCFVFSDATSNYIIGIVKSIKSGDCNYKTMSGYPIEDVHTHKVYTLKGPETFQWKTDNVDTSTAGTSTNTESDFEREINNGCSINPLSFKLSGCLLYLTYYTYFQLPAFILWLSAQFFNALLPISLDSSAIASSKFVPAAWGVVRDFSNIFFILILLYIAIKVILGLGGHDVKKMIVNVVIMALLINFSMFFTKIVIDSSNVLALVFYNKLDTTYKDSSGNKAERPNTPSTPYNEKDLSGAMYKNFNATNMINGSFIDTLKTTTINGQTTKEPGLPFAITFGIMVIAGSIMLFAAYSFFVSGLMFLGRLIELWVLIIFSPFAFMSFAVPKLAGVDYIGWEAWSKRIISTSFMAPIFMFFMYLIFKLLEVNVFSDFTRGDGAIAQILKILIPALIILTLLLKATDFAKKGGGKFGEALMTGAKLVGGLAVAAASGGAALAGQAAIGGAGGAGLGKLAEKANEKGFGRTATWLQDSQKFVQGRSFDIRNVKIAGKTLAGATGLNLGEANKTGWTGMKKEMMSKRQERANELKQRASAGTQKEIEEKKIKLHEAEMELKDKELPEKLKLDELEKEITKARQELNDAKAADDQAGISAAAAALKTAKDAKNDLRQKSGIKDAEKNRNLAKNEVEKTEQMAEKKEHHAAEEYAKWTESKLSKTLNVIARGGLYSIAGADEAARKIKANIKIESVVREKKSGDGGHGPTKSKPANSTPPAPSGGGHATPAH